MDLRLITMVVMVSLGVGCDRDTTPPLKAGEHDGTHSP